jgi:multiple sugar transport system substrate-binding protein
MSDGPTRVRLVDLSEAIGSFADVFDRHALDSVTLVDATTGRRGLYLLPMGFATHHLHAWKSLLERAGFILADIPKEWDAFWAFWCDQVQPAVRQALGRDDIWGVGLTMSVDSRDTTNGLWQFVSAYEADYMTRDGRLVIDDPEVGAGSSERSTASRPCTARAAPRPIRLPRPTATITSSSWHRISS